MLLKRLSKIRISIGLAPWFRIRNEIKLVISHTSTGTGVNMEPEVAPGTPKGTNTDAFIFRIRIQIH